MAEFNSQNYWENRLRKAFDLHGVGYDGLGKYYNQWMYKVRNRVFQNSVKRTCQEFNDTKALDIGCGTGFYVKKWNELGVTKITGIDITKVAIERLREQYPDCLFFQFDISGDLEPFAATQFDFISAFDVLFHIVEDRRFEIAIHNIHSLLKPNGLFLWSDNFLHDDEMRFRHQVSRSLNTIEQTLHSAGFQIVERRPMFYLMNAPYDNPGYPIKILWKLIKFSVSRVKLLGFFVGGLLYPLELTLTSVMVESPTTEIMICKKY